MQKTLRLVIINTLISTVYFFYAYYSEANQFPQLAKYLDVYLWIVLTVNFIGWFFVQTSKKLNDIFPWTAGFGKRFFTGLIINNLLAYCIATIMILLYFIFPFTHLGISEFMEAYNDLTLKLIFLIFLSAFIYTLVDLAHFSYTQYAITQIESIKLKRIHTQLQYEALKKQLSPHFLFNSLNTASSLIYRDTGLAIKFIRELGISYDYILHSINERLITIGQEIEISKAYAFLMETRFENAFTLKIDLPEEFNTELIPPLSIQMLLENAIKHNQINTKQPILVEIYTDDKKYINVRNNYIAKPYYLKLNNHLIEHPEMEKKSKIGLENINKRYAYFTRKKIIIEKNEYFCVKLPIIEKVS